MALGTSRITPRERQNSADNPAAALAGKIKKSRELRRSDVLSWDMVLRFLRGDQYLGWGSARTGLISTAPSASKNATVTNKLLKHDRTAQSLLATSWPKVTVKPMSASPDDAAKSIAAHEWAHYIWHSTGLKTTLHKNNRWLIRTGNCALHVRWFNGKLAIESVGAYDLLFEPHAISLEQSAWYACRYTHERRELEEAYPESAGFLAMQPSLSHEPDRQAQQMPEDRIEVWFVYYKTGEMKVLCNDRFLLETTTPGGTMPVIPYGFFRLEDSVYAMAHLWPLLDQQRTYNKFKNFGLDIADACSNTPWLVPSLSGVNKAQLQNDPRAVIEYNAIGGRPTREPAPQVPPHIFEIQNRADAEMDDSSGIHAPTTGRARSSQSGVAMETQIGRDIAQLASVMQEIEEAVCEVLRVSLIFCQTYITEAQAVSIFDESEGTVLHRELLGTDLVANPEVYIESGTLFPIQSQNRDTEVKELFGLGMMDGPTALGELSTNMDRKNRVRRMQALAKAQDILDTAKQGQEVRILPSDDLAAFKEVFNNYVGSPAFYETAELAKVAYEQMPSDETATVFVDALGRQEYITEILVSLQVPLDLTMQDVQALAQRSVFPRIDATTMPQPSMGQQQPAPAVQPRGTPPGPPKPPGRAVSGPVPNAQRAPGTGNTRGNPLESSASNVAGGVG